MLGKIAWKNIIYKPLNTGLCIILLLFGVGIISLILLIQHQIEQKFERDLQNIDLVVGAKGSPLQLVLSAIYHLDAPTGNIKLTEAHKIMNNPMVKEAIPLSYGDSYKGFRILGTTPDYITKYSAKFDKGKVFSMAMEVTLGADVAVKTGLAVGATFLGNHGEVKEGHVHEEHPYTITGILQKTNTVLDRLVLTNLESVWQVHSDHETVEHSLISNLQKDDESHLNSEGEHEHDEKDKHEHAEHTTPTEEKEITAILLKFKTKMAMLNIPRTINEQTKMQAVIPGLEINRLFYMLGVGATTLKLIAGGIMLVASFSVFFVLYNRLQDRKYELALMRSVGYSPFQLFQLLVLEGLLLAILGFVLGWILCRVGIYFISRQTESDFNIEIGAAWVPGEEWLLLITLLVGFVSAIIPAWQAMRLDVSEVLSKN